VTLVAARVGDFRSLPQDNRLSATAAYRGWFLSSSAAFDRYWYAGAYTAQVDTLAAAEAGLFYEGIPGLPPTAPIMVDGAKRDRYIWYDLAGPKDVIPMLYGDWRTPRDTLAALAEEQTPQGVIPACRDTGSFYGAPCGTAWTDASGWWVIALGEYWLWTGDHAFLRSMYPHVSAAIAALGACATSSRLIDACHGGASYDGPEVGGPTAYLNDVYYEALRTAAVLARADRRSRDAIPDEDKARRVAQAINEHLWDPHRAAYICSVSGRDCYPQDGNALAAFWGVANPMRARALRYIKRELWTRVGTTSGGIGENFGTAFSDLVVNWISYFEMEARLRYGGADELNSMLSAAWQYMNVDWKRIPGTLGNTEEPPSMTDWEEIVAPGGGIFRANEGSLSHVWSAGATAVETRAFLGVAPESPGFVTWRVEPHTSDSGLRWAEGQVPLATGAALRVSWSIQGPTDRPTAYTLHVAAPTETTGTVYVPLYGRTRNVLVNGRRASGVHSDDYLRISGVRGPRTFRWSGPGS
jgi:hypothetical protein